MKKVLIVYDSVFGNTEQVAQAIGSGLGPEEDVDILKAGGTNPNQLAGLKLLIVGSPTQRFRPTPAISNLLQSIPDNSLKGVKVAAFDTRLTTSEINKTPILAFFVSYLGMPPMLPGISRIISGKKAENWSFLLKGSMWKGWRVHWFKVNWNG